MPARVAVGLPRMHATGQRSSVESMYPDPASCRRRARHGLIGSRAALDGVVGYRAMQRRRPTVVIACRPFILLLPRLAIAATLPVGTGKLAPAAT